MSTEFISAGDTYKLTVYGNLFAGIVYGVYIVLYATSVYILLSKPGFTSSRPRKIMLGTTTFMFVLGFITLVLQTVLGFQQQVLLSLTQADDVQLFNGVNVAIIVFSRLMYILSDIICAWRAVVLWDRDKRVVAILVLFILVTIAAAGVDLSPYLRSVSDNLSILIFAAPTLGTNLLSTGLIAWKFWRRRVSVRKHLFEASVSVRVDRTFAMFIESGFVYCCLWISYLISVFINLSEQYYTVFNTVLVFVAGLYPTLIIILVSIQLSPVEYHSTHHSTGMQFTRNPAPVPPSMKQHEYGIGREYVSDSDTQSPSAVFIEISEEKILSVE